jgi:hypothetical protein
MIEIIGRQGIVTNETTGFTFETNSNPREFDSFRQSKDDIEIPNNFYYIGDWRILPYGTSDNLPTIIKKTVQENSTAPGMLEKKFMMTWGKGPYLYREEIEDGDIVKKLVIDPEIQAWLDSWDYQDYLMKCAIDYDYMKGAFTKVFRSKSTRIGYDGKIAKLEHVLMDNCRLACHKTSQSPTPTHAVITDYELKTLDSITNMKVYPLFDPQKPFNYPTAITYSNQYTFGDEVYSNPPISGSLEWLKRSTATPIIFKALSKNSINIKYHVESPEEFWNQQEERIKAQCIKTNTTYEEKMLTDFRREFLEDLVKVLANEENTGKLWHTRKILEVQGTNVLEHGWKITVIDQKIKDFVTAQIAISQRADRAVSAGIGLHGSIGNIAESGKSDSGSEQLYAYQNFVNSGVEVPELIICKPLNWSIRINFPDKNVKIGFRQTTTKREQDVSPKNRLKNQ